MLYGVVRYSHSLHTQDSIPDSSVSRSTKDVSHSTRDADERRWSLVCSLVCIEFEYRTSPQSVVVLLLRSMHT